VPGKRLLRRQGAMLGIKFVNDVLTCIIVSYSLELLKNKLCFGEIVKQSLKTFEIEVAN
jgi:hypothetical protein